ncbi:hypothetical protein A2U01_0034471, partial [Trifolium medium]|nr:hypothetical protein [Trifolium medium]
ILYLVDLYRIDVDRLEAVCELRLTCLAEECLSKNEIRSRPLLGGVCFGIFIGVPLIYGTSVL